MHFSLTAAQRANPFVLTLFLALTGSAFFSGFAAFVLCLNDVSDQVQSAAVLTASLHQPAFFFPQTISSVLVPYCSQVCGFIAVIMHSSRFHTSNCGFKQRSVFSIMNVFVVNWFQYSSVLNDEMRNECITNVLRSPHLTTTRTHIFCT